MINLVFIAALTLFFSQDTLAISIADHFFEQSKGEAKRTNPHLDKRMKALQQTSQQGKSLLIKTSQLKDSTGLVYIGGKISAADLAPYLNRLEVELGREFANYRQNQAARDQQTFHLTLINPYEYQMLDSNKVKLGQGIRVNLIGLGKVTKEGGTAYFVVAESSDGKFLRQNLLLQPKDFHVTLGFQPQDVFGVSKGRDTLIQ